MKEVCTNNFSDADDADYTNRKRKKNIVRHLCNLRLKIISEKGRKKRSYSSLNSASLSDCNAAFFLSHSRMRERNIIVATTERNHSYRYVAHGIRIAFASKPTFSHSRSPTTQMMRMSLSTVTVPYL